MTAVAPAVESANGSAGPLLSCRDIDMAYGPNEIGYRVGGGCALFGHEPTPDEGTWGWDYGGWVGLRQIALHCSINSRQHSACDHLIEELNNILTHPPLFCLLHHHLDLRHDHAWLQQHESEHKPEWQRGTG